MPTTHCIQRKLLAAAAVLALAACGGGGGDASAPAAPSLKITGVAATGLAIANGQVQAKCGIGAGAATTQANGSYTIDIAGGSLPCVFKVTAASGAVLHSAIDGSGAASLNVNITPLTELVVAKASVGAPASLFETFDAAAQAKITGNTLNAAMASVASALQGAVDLSGVNPIKDTLVAANGPTAGNALDQKLDTLQAVLSAARTTLAELAAAVAASGDTAAPVQTMLRPAAAGCTGMRSGRYAWLSPVGDSTATLVDINATTLVIAYTADNGDPGQVSMIDSGGCAYNVANDGQSSTKMLVSKSGITVARDTATSGANAGSSWVSGVLVPLQTIALSELAGTWNFVEYFRDPINGQPAFAPSYGSLVFDGSGKLTGGTGCDASGTCAAHESVGASLSVNPSGGFNAGGNAVEPPSRFFPFKTADGHLSMFLVYSASRGMVALTKQVSLPLPAVGTVANIWDFSIGSNGLASALTEQTTSVTAVDAAAGTLTRLRAADNRVDSFKNNDPQTGMRSRAANSCTINGAPTTCAGITSLALAGAGVSMYVSAAPQNFFGISIAKP